MTDSALRPGFQKYWVLLIDLMGFARRMASPEDRLATAATYQKVVADLANPAVQEFVLGRLITTYRRRASDPGLGQEDRDRYAQAAEHLETVFVPALRADPSWGAAVHIFSDSIFIFFRDEDLDFATTASRTFAGPVASLVSARLWQAGVPHRGALAYGECLVTEKVFLGLPIVRAYEWEKAQNWLGISVEPSSRVAASDSKVFLGHEALVPTKSGRIPVKALPPIPETPEGLVATTKGFAAAFEDAQGRGVIEAIAKYVETAALWLRFGYRLPAIEAIAEKPELGLPTKLIP